MRSTSHLAAVLLSLLAIGTSPARAQPAAAPPTDNESFERAGNALRDLIGSVWTPQGLYTDSTQVRKAFRGSVAAARRATVRVRVDGKNRSLGGVVGPDGWVLTKASRLAADLNVSRRGPEPGPGRVTVRLNDGRELDARTVGIDRDYDLAMLKVEATDLPSLVLDKQVDPVPGDWVATVGPTRDPIAIGVVSVRAREIAHRPGILGIRLGDSPGEGVLVDAVSENTGAEAAGILTNDRVTAVNGEGVSGRLELIKTVQQYSPGDTVDVTLLREGQSLTLRVTLTGRNRVEPMNRSEYQNSLGGMLSQRRFGFPSALQHDTALEASECGGPLVDLEGRVVGFNLSRSGRTESYAVPASELPNRLFSLMSGQQPPEAE